MSPASTVIGQGRGRWGLRSRPIAFDPTTGRPGVRRLLLRWAAPGAAGAGGMMATAYPQPGWWVMAWLATPLLLACLAGRGPRGAVVVGLSYGLTLHLILLRWVASFAGAVPWLALVGLQTLLFAAGAVAISWLLRRTDQLWPGRAQQLVVVPLLVAAVWTSRELLVGMWPYGGFPWARLSVTQVDGPAAQALSWFGADGLTMAMVAVGTAAVQLWRRTQTAVLPGAVLPAGLMGLLLFSPQFPTVAAGALTVGWVQGNGPAGYFDAREPGAMLTAQTRATEAILGQRMDLLVWPEGGVDSDPLNRPATAAALDAVVQRAGAPLLVNGSTSRGPRSYNTTLVWTDAGVAGLYDKRHPVPFGEYLPDRWLYQRLAPRLVSSLTRDYAAGVNPPLVRIDGVTIGLAICFDVIYDEVAREGIRNGAQMFVFQSNNADFRGTDENLQQLAFARLRSVETGRSVLNVSTVGTSQLITPDGDVIEQAGVDQQAARISTVPLRNGMTPAVILGPWLKGLIAGTALIGATTLAGLHRRQRHRKDQ